MDKEKTAKRRMTVFKQTENPLQALRSIAFNSQRIHFLSAIKDIRDTLISKLGPTKKQLSAIFHLLINQTQLRYGVSNMLRSSIRCLCCRSISSLRTRQSPIKRVELIYRHGERKLTRDLDIVNLIDSIKEHRCMLKVLFDINQLFFLKFQRRDVLNSDSELEHEQFDDEALEQYKKLLVQGKLADSSKRDKAKDEIRNKLQKYHGKPLTQKDFRVLQGVLSYSFKNLEQKEVVRD